MNFRAPAFAIVCSVLALLGLSTPARAADDEAAPSASASSAPESKLHFTEGPAPIDLGHAVTLQLPASDRFLGPADSDKVLRAMGNLHNENVLGIVVAKEGKGDWFVVLDWSGEEGHIKDDESVDAAKLLEQLRAGQKEANEERKQQGYEELSLEGWQVPPSYDKGRHQLSWALVVVGKDGKSVNFNTRILGRTSFVSVDLVTDPTKLEEHRTDAMTIVDATAFTKGQRYEDFDSAKDKVAEYGLAGLIAGGAGLAALKFAKIGLLAKFWKLILGVLIAGKKAIVLALAAAAGFFKKLFGGKGETAKQPESSAPPNEPPPNA